MGKGQNHGRPAKTEGELLCWHGCPRLVSMALASASMGIERFVEKDDCQWDPVVSERGKGIQFPEFLKWLRVFRELLDIEIQFQKL